MAIPTTPEEVRMGAIDKIARLARALGRLALGEALDPYDLRDLEAIYIIESEPSDPIGALVGEIVDTLRDL